MNMIHKFLPCLAVILSSSLQLQAQSIPDTCSNDFRNWIRTIGSDGFGGRKPMTPYETKKNMDCASSLQKGLQTSMETCST